MDTQTLGLVVIYRWRVNTGMEEQCRRGWEAVTREFIKERGGLGSRLHIDEDGTWWAYAQWPDRSTWSRAQGMGAADGSEAMQAAMDKSGPSHPPVLLEPTRDLLVPVTLSPNDE